MSTNENVNAPYEVNGKNYKSFNEYFIAQAVAAQQDIIMTVIVGTGMVLLNVCL